MTSDKLETFLYLLARDHLPFGQVTESVHAVETCSNFELLNKEMKIWSREVAKRLRE